jgi:hypothetical protein
MEKHTIGISSGSRDQHNTALIEKSDGTNDWLSSFFMRVDIVDMCNCVVFEVHLCLCVETALDAGLHRPCSPFVCFWGCFDIAVSAVASQPVSLKIDATQQLGRAHPHGPISLTRGLWRSVESGARCGDSRASVPVCWERFMHNLGPVTRL